MHHLVRFEPIVFQAWPPSRERSVGSRYFGWRASRVPSGFRATLILVPLHPASPVDFGLPYRRAGPGRQRPARVREHLRTRHARGRGRGREGADDPVARLLCFMIPLFGIGKVPVLVALSLYALLPIVRGAYTGLITLDRQLPEIADVLGLSARQRLVKIELPLASV